ncbi:MAG: (2Fe-2S) ferredoxin domain-containing protein [Candidatus Gastranaerophilaceae bacterium]
MTVTIKVCMGSACFARENAENIEFLEKYIKDNGLEDKIELLGSRCEGACADGPNIYINDKKYTKVDTEKLKSLVEGLFNE